jgi:hypothetical protein
MHFFITYNTFIKDFGFVFWGAINMIKTNDFFRLLVLFSVGAVLRGDFKRVTVHTSQKSKKQTNPLFFIDYHPSDGSH